MTWYAQLDCASGRELISQGYAADVDMASQLNVTTAVPLLKDGVYGAN